MPVPPAAVITVVGNVTDDPELKFTPSGAPVCNFTVAVNERVLVGEEWKDGETTFYRVAAWRGLAENVAESLAKGVRVIVNGTFKARTYDRQDGGKGTSLDLTANFVGPELTFATAQVTRSNRSGNGSGQQSAPAQNNGWGGGQQAAAANQNPWGGGGQAAPAQQNPWGGGGGVATDEPPF